MGASGPRVTPESDSTKVGAAAGGQEYCIPMVGIPLSPLGNVEGDNTSDKPDERQAELQQPQPTKGQLRRVHREKGRQELLAQKDPRAARQFPPPPCSQTSPRRPPDNNGHCCSRCGSNRDSMCSSSNNSNNINCSNCNTNG